MRLFRWIKNKTYPPALIADNAAKQYRKAIYKNLGESPEEIAELMWNWRYLNAALDTENKWRLSHYVESDFPITTIIDFCLGSFDIEFKYGPNELEFYDYAANYIGRELQKNGVPCTMKDVESFINKWNRFIGPLR
jgi:hypothetical protein